MVNNGAVEPDAPTAAPAPVLGKREGRSPRDMALSLAVLLIPIALLITFYRMVLSGDAPVNVDPTSTLQEARAAAVFPVLEPQGLGDDWSVTTATFRRETAGATLRLGYVDPDDDPVLLVQSSVPPQTLLPAELGEDPRPRDTFRTPSGVWRLYDSRPGESALVLAEQGRTVLVVGRTDAENLRTMAGSLRG